MKLIKIIEDWCDQLNSFVPVYSAAESYPNNLTVGKTVERGGFLLFPKTINGVTKWLVDASWTEQLILKNFPDSWFFGKNCGEVTWHEVRWL